MAEPIKLKAFNSVGPADIDRKLCPVRALLQYRKVTATPECRKGRSKLFISYKPSMATDIKKATISSLIVKLIRLACSTESEDPRTLELHKISAHEVRALSVSCSVFRGMSVDTVLQPCTWKSRNTFSDLYLRDIFFFNDVNRRIAIATSTMSKLSSLWTSSRLSLVLKMRLYNSLIISIITYSSASWTLTKAQKKRLDAFNTKALRRIVGVRWHDFVTNASILIRTGQPPLTTTIRKLRLSAFGHICRLQPGTQAIDILASTPPSTWHRPRGRPPLRWADQIVNDTQLSLSDAVTATQDRTSWRSLVRDATRPATQAT